MKKIGLGCHGNQLFTCQYTLIDKEVGPDWKQMNLQTNVRLCSWTSAVFLSVLHVLQERTSIRTSECSSMTMSPALVHLWWSGLFSVLVFLPLILSCEQGKAGDCAEAEFAPGSNLAGEGFDITKMERKGSFVIDMKRWDLRDKSCTLCQNPFMEGKKQKLPVSVVDWKASQKCSMKVSSSIYQSSESLVSASTSTIENNWSMNLGIDTKRGEGSLTLAGSDSKLAEYSMEKTKKDKFSFTSHSISCAYYR